MSWERIAENEIRLTVGVPNTMDSEIVLSDGWATEDGRTCIRGGRGEYLLKKQ